jgi:transposase-like protein
MTEKRLFFSPEEKVSILREHLLEKKPLSDLCDKYQIQPALFYRWQKQFFEKGTAAFREEDNSKKNFYEQKIANLQQRLERKNEVVSELMEESLKLKKSLGET